MYSEETEIPDSLPSKESLYGNIESKLFTSIEELQQIGYYDPVVTIYKWLLFVF